jgi:alpha-amylase/alpha-mannosidase (GH57 family)
MGFGRLERDSSDEDDLVRRFICIHGHFYQPPRENAWLERIERQESARPFHDWNARIEAECYGPNARAKILDSEEHLVSLNNNFERISYNVGPTLLSWLEAKAPKTYARIIAADAASAKAMGRGSAMAQAHGHIIMPLANERDRRTQVRWGIADFKRRFGRMPEGMWLPETAACTNSLRALAEEGILFTVLAPSQVSTVRRASATAFSPPRPGGFDTRQPYRVDLGGDRSITVFFYDGHGSQAVAFERLLADGDSFANRLMSRFSAEPTQDELVHIATDGETYGHHHRFGEMALAYALRRFDRDPSVELTNYASFLARGPVTDEATIVESSAWSCAHGVGRWSRDCGCKTRSIGSATGSTCCTRPKPRAS